jgi:hypothetical protein
MAATEAAEEERPEPVLEEHRAIVTYRHIQDRWGLGGPDAARVKARRAGWGVLPKNHPGDTTRLVIPRSVWGAATPAAARSPGASGSGSGIDPGEHRAGSAGDPRGSNALAAAVDALREQYEHEQERAEARAGQAEAERDAARAETAAERARAAQAEREREESRIRAAAAEGEAVALREQIKAERDRAVTWLRETEAARDAARSELTEWTAGGPLARSVRAFLNRRGRR